jgi:hypothetical protein
MMQPRLVIKPSSTTTRLLLTANEDLLCATLPPPRYPHAAHTLLTGLALWLDQPLSIVLCAGELASLSALNRYDDFGFGAVTAHYQVEIVEPGRRRRGLGSSRELHRLNLRGVR